MRKDQDFVDEYDEDENDKSHKIRKENQYFDDELPQKAVSGLFKGGEKAPIVKGYDDPDAVEPEGIIPPRKRQAKNVEPDGEGFVRGFERKAAATPQPKARPIALEDSEEEAFTLYRKKKNIEVNAKPAVRVAKGSAAPASRPVDKPVRQPVARRDEETEQPYDDEDYDTFKEKYKNREYIPSPKQPRTAAKRMAPAGGPEYDDYEDGGEGSTVLKVALVVVSCVFLIILAILVVRINSTSAQLKEANKKLETASKNEVEIASLKMEKDALKAERDSLQAENAELKSAAVSAPPEDTEGDTESDTEGAESGAAVSSTGEKIHTVAAGETLSKISQTYYGSPGQYEKIKQANNLTSNDLSVGQRLKIPD